MTNFSREKNKDKYSDWKSLSMYTHLGGYKFCVGVDANGWLSGHGNSIFVDLWALPGEFDDQLKWPAKEKFTIKLINQQGGKNVSHTTVELQWHQPVDQYERLGNVTDFYRIPNGFLEHTQLIHFLKYDTLSFHVFIEL